MNKFLTIKRSWLSSICLLLTAFCLLLSVPAYAAMSGGGYSIPSLTVDGGGQTMSSDGYEVLDMKGQSVIGVSGDGRVGLGGIYGLIATGEAPVISDAGLIRNTWIERDGDIIRLHWERTLGVSSVDIWRLSGPGRVFTSATADWDISVAIRIDVDALSFEDPAITAGDGNNAYYRVVPHDTPRANIFGSDPGGTPYNERTVGKIDVSLAANDLQLISMPMYSVRASEALSDQIPAGQQVTLYPQSGGGLNALMYSGGSLAGDFDIAPNRGFWIQNDATAKVLTFVGRFINVETRAISSLDLTGNPLPLNIGSSAVGGGNNDIIYLQSGGGLNAMRYSGGWAGSFTIGLGQGLWYQPAAVSSWGVNLVDERATIERL